MVDPSGAVGPAMVMTAAVEEDDNEPVDFVLNEETGEMIVMLAEIEEEVEKNKPYDPWDYMSEESKFLMVMLAMVTWIFLLAWWFIV